MLYAHYPYSACLYSLPFVVALCSCRSSGSGPQNVVQMSVHLSSTLLEVTMGFLEHVLGQDLSLDILNLLGSSFLFSTLLPTTLAQLGPVSCKQPKVTHHTPVGGVGWGGGGTPGGLDLDSSHTTSTSAQKWC